jgi:competence protein CoiA
MVCMEWALLADRRQLATPGAVGACPSCGARLIAKCGKVYAWHWAHEACDCDPWSEPEGRWHRGWKQLFPAEWREVVIRDHRADLRVPGGVIELQHSSISAGEIEERERFYGRMVWVVNAEEWNLEPHHEWRLREFYRNNREPEWPQYCWQSNELSEKDTWIAYRQKQDAIIASHDTVPEPHFRWLWPRKSWLAAKRKVYLDRGGDELFLIKRTYAEGRYLITRRISKQMFIAGMLGTKQRAFPRV